MTGSAIHYCASVALALVMASAAAGTFAADTPLDAATVNDVASIDGKAGMLRAQVLLERARFSPGEIDGAWGANSARAVRGFQRSRGLEVTGELDAPTWQALNHDGAEALVPYTITAEDVAGPFTSLSDDIMEQAKLPALGYESVDEALGERFHASPALLRRLNPGQDLASAGSVILVPNVAGLAPLAKAAKVVVDKSESTLSVLDDAGKVLAQFPATTGSEHDPLPIGEWKIEGVAVDPTFHYNPELFWDANPEHAKATLPPGPNSPVGVVWVDLSKPHYGIHGTPEPSRIAKTQSHGCIRLSNWSAKALVAAVSPGTPAVLQE